ncbi:multidrug MFS transporter [Carbonactinospora thermoautotrophica]|uniref:Drug resistance transporter n=2 Tax=Carbonactinospora thermoautotrophica TaxID=1469144 RepID=A0A132MQU7_9ACTN|nr:MFS transporter [Carbonactinospora thermoautotrophica]KWX00213.1 multidrug MFS transporter [Carbonactinospora thermoautotrophica]KWX01772.1 Drug resistance transporter [Carbonactinospora thermoautotrophica]
MENASTQPTTDAGHPRRWTILAVLVFSLLVVVLDNSILNVALRVIADPRQGLGATQSELEWAINSYTLVFAGLLFTWGVLGDRYGRKRVLLLGMALFGLASLVSAYAQSPGQLIVMRALMGFGGAAILPNSLAIITNVFSARERIKAFAVWSGAVGLAIAIGPVTGGFLLEHFWWGSIFLVNVPIVALGSALMLLVVPESRNPRPGRLDPLGVVLSIAALVTVVYGIIRAGQLGTWLTAEVLATLAVGLGLLVLFVRHEARSDHPALDVRLFRDPRLSASAAAIALVFFALMGVTFFMVFYLQSVRGFGPLESGAVLLPMAVAQLLLAPRSAALAQRFGTKAVAAGGLAGVALMLYAISFADRDLPIWQLEIILFLLGAGMAHVMSPVTDAVMTVVPREQAGAGSAINNISRQVGGALGVAVLGSLLSSVYRSRMGERLAFLPPGTRHAAGESIEATLAAARQAGPRGATLVGPAMDAFVHAMHVVAWCSAAVAALGVLVVLVWLPQRPHEGRPGAPAAPAGTEPARALRK